MINNYTNETMTIIKRTKVKKQKKKKSSRYRRKTLKETESIITCSLIKKK